MERAKLKLAVIILLALLNACLLGLVLRQTVRFQVYEQESRTQAMVYLENRGIRAEEETIPWDSRFLDVKADPRSLLFDPGEVPQDSAVSSWEILSMRQPETLVVDFVRGLSDLGETCTEIRSVAEGYVNMGGESRVVLTPMWNIFTDNGAYQMNCATGALTREG